MSVGVGDVMRGGGNSVAFGSDAFTVVVIDSLAGEGALSVTPERTSGRGTFSMSDGN